MAVFHAPTQCRAGHELRLITAPRSRLTCAVALGGGRCQRYERELPRRGFEQQLRGASLGGRVTATAPIHVAGVQALFTARRSTLCWALNWRLPPSGGSAAGFPGPPPGA